MKVKDLLAIRPDRAWILHFFVLFASCVLSIQLTFQFFTSPAIFPFASGVGLAGLILGGISIWPAIFLAAFVSYYLHDAGLFITLVLSAAYTLQTVLAAYILQKFKFDPRLRRMRDVFALMAVGVTVSTIVPTLGIIGYAIQEAVGGKTISIAWGSWWVGHMSSLLILTPFIVRWLCKPLFTRTSKQILEIGAALVILCIVNYDIFWTAKTSFYGFSAAYLLFGVFFWIALRLGARFTTLALVLTGLIAHLGVVYGNHAQVIAALSVGERLYETEIFLIFMAFIYYIVVSIENERRYAVSSLQSHVSSLETALQRISSEDEAKSEFLAVLAHELRNPLAPIMSALEFLKLKGIRAEEAEGLVEMMTGRVKTMSRLLDDLLDIARISRGKMKFRKETLELCEVIRRSLRSINELTINKTHTFDISLPAEPVYVEGDVVRLEQIIVNLLKNSVKYTPPGGHISIFLTRENSQAELTIKDTGVGIPRDMLEKIFDPFVQGHSASVDGGGTGLGIGLSLTRMLVEMHGGTIRAKSDGTGKGSEFTVRFPVLPPKSAIEVTPSLFGFKKLQIASHKILVVDDNVFAANGLGRLLQHKGHEAAMSYAGREALDKITEYKPDIILLDIGLPDMNGYEVARTLRTQGNFTGVLIALTGYGQEEDKQKAFDAGFDFHLTKPVSISDVEGVFEKLALRAA